MTVYDAYVKQTAAFCAWIC